MRGVIVRSFDSERREREETGRERNTLIILHRAAAFGTFMLFRCCEILISAMDGVAQRGTCFVFFNL